MQRQDKPPVLIYTFIFFLKNLNPVAHNIFNSQVAFKIRFLSIPGSVKIFEKQNGEL